MKKKIKNSLAAKIFLLALCLLMLCNLATCFFISLLMPKTYSMYLNDSLNERVENLIDALKTVTIQNSGVLFDSFLNSSDISSLKLINEHGAVISLPTQMPPYDIAAVSIGNIIEGLVEEALEQSEVFYDSDILSEYNSSYPSEYIEQNVQSEYHTALENFSADIALVEGTSILEENAEPLTMQSFDFSFLDSDLRYHLLVCGNPKPIHQIKQVFLWLMPLLVLLTILIASITAVLFSYIVTKPILKICGIAHNMSQLSFDWQCDETRTDELGILEKSLNILSYKLSNALSSLQTANQKLKDDMEKEKQFFSAVSHELKTPITVIKGQLEGMLFDIGVYKDHKKYLSRSLSVAGTLETMVQEILTVSRLETTALPHSQLDMAPLIKSYLLSTEDLIVNKELSLHTQIDAPALVTGNKIMLSKVIGNLISNAIFYSPPQNTISLSAKMVEGIFTFQIENTGVHIPEEALPKIFDPFYRVEQSRNRQTGGSGLGLYIAQKILEQHHSCCTAKNTEKGVCFSFVLRQIE